MDFFQDGRCSAQAKPRAAIDLGDQHRQKTSLSQGRDKFGGIGSVPVLGPPIGARKLTAKPSDGFSNFWMGL